MKEFIVPDLFPDTDYPFVIRTFTPADPYGPQRNHLLSEPSEEVHGKTNAGGTTTTADATTENSLVYKDTVGNKTSVEIPAGAVTETISFLYTPIETITTPASLSSIHHASGGSDVPLSYYAFANHAFKLNAYRDGILDHGFSFEEQVTVTMEYTDTDITKIYENSLKIFYWDESQSQ